MDINEFGYLLQEYALDNDNYKMWRETHEKAFGKIFTSAFEESPEAQIHLTAALIRISQRDFNGGLEKLLMLEQFSSNDADCFALSYFIGFCYECLENEKEMNKYYENMSEYNADYKFLIGLHPYYRTAKFAQRKSENEKALIYYGKALALYSENESDTVKTENMAQICYDMGTVYLSCQQYEKSREFLEKSYKFNPAENPQRNYVMAILCAIEGKQDESEKIANSLPDYLKSNCGRVIASIRKI